MAKSIAPTPAVECEDVLIILQAMLGGLTGEDKEFAKEIRNQGIVLFS